MIVPLNGLPQPSKVVWHSDPVDCPPLPHQCIASGCVTASLCPLPPSHLTPVWLLAFTPSQPPMNLPPARAGRRYHAGQGQSKRAHSTPDPHQRGLDRAWLEASDPRGSWGRVAGPANGRQV